MKPRGGEGQNGRLKCPMGFLVFNSTRFGRLKPQHMHNINLTVFLKYAIICPIKIVLYSIVVNGTVIAVACWTCENVVLFARNLSSLGRKQTDKLTFRNSARTRLRDA